MEFSQLNKILKEKAVSLGICKKFYREWTDNVNIDILLDMYVRGLDFCIDNDYPNIDFIRENISLDDLHRHNIFLDEHIEMDNAFSGTYILLGNCTGYMNFELFSAATIHVRHNSNITLRSTEGSIVNAFKYENSTIKIEKDYSSTGKVYDKSEGL